MGDDMYRFLLRPRWIAGHVLVAVAVITFVNLGFWQLRRLDERREYNALVTQRLQAQPVPLDELLRTVGSDAGALEYRRVVVSGRYQPDSQLLTAPRSRDGRPGPQVLTVLDRGEAGPVLVDRGWIPFARNTVRAPVVRGGEVRVDGIVRAPEPGAIGSGQQVARIVPAQIAARNGQPLPAFYVELWDQRPAPVAADPLPASAPALTEGNHQSYAFQWFAFALIALVGYPALLWRTAHERADHRAGTQDSGAHEPRSAHVPIP
jgi:cytochrome oxidase assembly protein ShyY1